MNRVIRRSLFFVGVLVVSMIGITGAAQADPAPFAYPCAAANGVRFCPSPGLVTGAMSFDGLPLDVDVTLPATGDGPWPTIVMAHPLAGNKTDFEDNSANGSSALTYHYNNTYYASRGYAVVNYSARGFGNSCGSSQSRTIDGCETGYVHLSDSRYDARDVQVLLGELVDEGITNPSNIGVTGISLGAGTTNELAFLKNRVRLPDGSFIPWKSPNGTPLSIKAAFPRWGWADLAPALLPNGRYSDTSVINQAQTITPVGIPRLSYVTVLVLGTLLTGYVGPVGGDPTVDLLSWYARFLQGEPFNDGDPVVDVVKQEANYHGILTIPGVPSSMLIENGWTDDLFPAPQALWTYNQARAASPSADVSLQLADVGHPRGANKIDVMHALVDRGSAFFDAKLKGSGTAPAAGSAALYKQTCPRSAATGAPITAASWAATHPGTLTFTKSTLFPQIITSSGFNYLGQLDKDPIVATLPGALTNIVTGLITGQINLDTVVGLLTGNPVSGLFQTIASGVDTCKTYSSIPSLNTAVFTGPVRTRAFTLAGMPKVTLNIATLGQNGQLDARLWDVDSSGHEILISRGEYRLTPNQSGQVTFQLDGNAFTFAAGHAPRLEVLSSDAPFLRPSNGIFSVSISKAQVWLPTVEALP